MLTFRIAIAIPLLYPVSTTAQDRCAMITDQFRRGHCYDAMTAQQRQWTMYNSWTSRQKQVSKLVSEFMDQYKKRFGTDLQPDPQGVAMIMQAVGAQPEEFAFVQGRMQAIVDANELLAKTDQQLKALSEDCRKMGLSC